MIDLKGRVDTLVGPQQRCPTGVVGRLIGERMARQHLPETLWTVALLDVAPTDRVLDIGCGAGQAIELVAARRCVVPGGDSGHRRDVVVVSLRGRPRACGVLDSGG